MVNLQAWESSGVSGILVTAQLWWELGSIYVHSFTHSFKKLFREL